MINNTIIIEVEYDLDNRIIKICDNSNYELSYIGATQNINGTLSITRNGASIYQNTTTISDIIPINNRCKEIDMVLNSKGNLDAGDYNIIYTVKDISDNDIVVYTEVCDICVKIPTEINISHRYDCLVPVFESIDITKYEPCDKPADLIERTHKLTYCSNGISFSEQPLDIVTTNSSILTNKLFTNSTVKSELWLKYTFNLCNNTKVVKTVYASRETKIECPADLCKINCCVKGLANKYIKAKDNGNEKEKEKTEKALFEVGALLSILKSSIDCKKTAGVDKIIAEIKEITNCEGDCGCNSETEATSTPIGAFVYPNMVITTCEDELSAVRDFDGQTYKYKLCLSDEIKDKLDCISDVVITGDEYIDVDEKVTINNTGCNVKDIDISFNYDKFIEGLCISGNGCGLKVEKKTLNDCEEKCIVISLNLENAIDILPTPNEIIFAYNENVPIYMLDAKKRVEIIKQNGCPLTFFINTSIPHPDIVRYTTGSSAVPIEGTELVDYTISGKYKKGADDVYNLRSNQVNNISAFQTFNVPPNTFQQNSDEVEVEYIIRCDIQADNLNSFLCVTLNGTVIATSQDVKQNDKSVIFNVRFILEGNFIMCVSKITICGLSDKTSFGVQSIPVSAAYNISLCSFEKTLNDFVLANGTIQHKYR